MTDRTAYERAKQTRETYLRWSERGLIDGMYWLVVGVVLVVLALMLSSWAYSYVARPMFDVHLSWFPSRPLPLLGLIFPGSILFVVVPTLSQYRRKNVHKLEPLREPTEESS